MSWKREDKRRRENKRGAKQTERRRKSAEVRLVKSEWLIRPAAALSPSVTMIGTGEGDLRIYAQKGHILSEAERLELGRLLLKAGYIAMLGKEKQGSTSRHYVEFYRKVELFGQKEAADEGYSFTDGDKKHEHRRIGEIDPEADADKPNGAQSAACLSAQSEGVIDPTMRSMRA